MKHVSNSRKKNFDSAKRQTLKSHRLTQFLRHDKKRPVVACCHRCCCCSVVCMHDICNLCWAHNLASSNEHRYNSKFWMKNQIHQLKTGSQNKTKTKKRKNSLCCVFCCVCNFICVSLFQRFDFEWTEQNEMTLIWNEFDGWIFRPSVIALSWASWCLLRLLLAGTCWIAFTFGLWLLFDTDNLFDLIGILKLGTNIG